MGRSCILDSPPGSADACVSWQKVQRREANRRRHRLTDPATKALCQTPPKGPPANVRCQKCRRPPSRQKPPDPPLAPPEPPPPKGRPDAWSMCLMRCIPKHSGEVGLGELLPICLENSCVNWVTQVILLQLEDALQQLTAPEQKGFMRKRRMIDHIWGVQGLWETHGDGGYLTIDFLKAYNSVAHDHMSTYLRFLALPEPYLRLIMSLVVSPILFCVGCEYVTEVELRPSSGVRQGVPLSRALFAMLTTVLIYDLRQLRIDLQIFFYAEDRRRSAVHTYILEREQRCLGQWR